MTIDATLWTRLPLLVLHLGLGLVLGAAYFLSLRRSVDGLVSGGGAMRALAMSLLRLLLLGVALLLVSREGAAPLVATALGIFVARFAVVRKVRATQP